MFFLIFSLIFERIPLGNDTIFFEPFDSPYFPKNWQKPRDSKFSSDYEIKIMTQPTTLPYERMLIFKSKKTNYILTSKIENFPNLEGKTFVLQYETRIPQYLDCSAAYIKLFRQIEPIVINEKTEPLLTFGPEICNLKSNILFKFQHFNKKTGKWTELSLKNPPKFKADGLNHLFTLIIKPDNSYEILIDGNTTKKGSLYNDFDPPVNGYKKIQDPNYKKPADWDEREYILDDKAKKPDDWDENAPYYIIDQSDIDSNGKLIVPNVWLENEPLYIEDPNVEKPENWDENLLGEFIKPLIPNPKCNENNNKVIGCGKYYGKFVKNPNYKGRWKRPTIKNPNYKGIWKPKMIDNPDYFVDNKPYLIENVGAVGFAIWTADGNIAFKNILLSNDYNAVKNTTIADFQKRKQTQINKEAEREQELLEELEREKILKRIERENKATDRSKMNWFQKFVADLADKLMEKKH